MKKIGLIGGMSWHSSALYYSYINEAINQRMGGYHSAELMLRSVDFATILQPWQQGDRQQALAPIIDAILDIEAAGADFFVICSNAIHTFADELTSAATIPILHIGEVISERIAKEGMQTVALLGTKLTMQGTFYKACLDKHAIKMLLPNQAEQEIIDTIIFSELIHGECNQSSRHTINNIIDGLQQLGAQGVILGCTELPLLLADATQDIVFFDTVKLHALAAVDASLKPSGLR